MQPRMLNNRYELLNPLGQGGMATVYRGRDTRLGRAVAVKLLRPQFATDQQFLQRFEHEAQAAGGLSAHPNIVDIYDVGQDNGVPYIVMELIDGQDLSTLIEKEGPLTPDRAIRIAEQAADGLEYAHLRGFVHRDVKPQNIMVGPLDKVKITDFGIAKSVLSTAVTQAGMTFGTADYISPEQAQGLGATAQSDIYSLGIVVYEMLTKHLPFVGDSPMAVALQQIQQPPPPLAQWNPAVPANLERIVLAALAKDPRQRPASAKAFATMLREYRTARSQETQVAPVVRPPVRPPVVPPQTVAKNSAPLLPVAPPRRNVPPPVAPPPLRQPAQPQSGGSPFAGLLLGILLLGGLLGLAYVAFATDTLQSLFGSGPAAAITALPTALPTPTTAPVQVVVGNYVGQQERVARDAITNAGLQFDLPDKPQLYPNFDAGQVAEQRPAPGTSLPQGSKVYLRISLGRPTAVVPPTPAPSPTPAATPTTPPPPTPAVIVLPNLVGQPGEAILTALTAAGFRANPVRQPNTTVPAGQIISQSPGPGSYPPDTVITVTISEGDVVRFPNVIGRDRAVAEAAIRGTANLVLDVVDLQGPDQLRNFNQIPPNQVVSATANGAPAKNGDLVPRTARIVLGVRRP